MKIACYIFITLISLVIVVAGIWQAYGLSRKRICGCNGVIVLATIGEADEVLGGDNPLRMYWPVVEYEYTVSGQTLKGERISIAGGKTSVRSEAEKRLRCYAVGKQVKVFYNADDAAEAYLKNPRKHIWSFLCWAFGMTLFGALMNFMIWKVVP